MRPRKRIFKHKGKPLLNGAFAVGKNEEEDRAISNLVPLNALIDTSKFWKPVFARVPSLRVVTVRQGKRLRTSKRDARHFFHQLAVGRRWQKYFAHPALPASDRFSEKVPCHRCLPMGFSGSVSWAQRLNESLVEVSGLPAERRLVQNELPPAGYPVWGSIIDDIWAVNEDGSEDLGNEWATSFADEWRKLGLQENDSKRVCGAPVAEVQGAVVHGNELWLGVSREKRALLMESGLWLVAQRRPLVKSIERWVGKLAFCQQFRVCTRATLDSTYMWMDHNRRAKRRRAVLWPAVRAEMLLAMLEVPAMYADLRSTWCPRVEASDASPGGHGRAWAWFDTEKVSFIGRACEGKGVYTNLEMPYGLEAPEGVCPMEQLIIDHDNYSWAEVSRRGGYRHITLEEGAAWVWSLHDRLRRPAEFNKKVVHLIDSAALAGAAKKGRSSSRRLNAVCRQGKVCIMAGQLDPYFPWVASARNPSDAASSRFGIRARPGLAPAPQKILLEPRPARTIEVPPAAAGLWLLEEPLVRRLVREGKALTNATWQTALPEVVFHFCSGPLRDGCFAEAIVDEFDKVGREVVVISLDPVVDRALDLLSPTIAALVRRLCGAGRVSAALGGPPCSTWSRARFLPLPGGQGPRPLRSMNAPLECLADRSEKEKAMCRTGTLLAMSCVYWLGLAWAGGAWIGMEHPEDLGPPCASLFSTAPVIQLLTFITGQFWKFDQCTFGAPTRKPTQILTCDSHTPSDFKRRCFHSSPHRVAKGLDSAGRFLTAPLAAYPAALCRALASCARHGRGTAAAHRPEARHRLTAAWIAIWQGCGFPALLSSAALSALVCEEPGRLQG